MKRILKRRYLIAIISIVAYLIVFNLVIFLFVGKISEGIKEVINMIKITILAITPLIIMIIYGYIKEREHFYFHVKAFIISVMSIIILLFLNYLFNYYILY